MRAERSAYAQNSKWAASCMSASGADQARADIPIELRMNCGTRAASRQPALRWTIAKSGHHRILRTERFEWAVFCLSAVMRSDRKS